MKKISALILDPDRSVRDKLGEQLRLVGVEHVSEATNIADALEIVAMIQTEIAFIDLAMINGSCGEFLNTIATYRFVPSLAIHRTARSAQLSDFEWLCQRRGLRYLGYMPSPIDSERLQRTVVQLRKQLAQGDPS